MFHLYGGSGFVEQIDCLARKKYRKREMKWIFARGERCKDAYKHPQPAHLVGEESIRDVTLAQLRGSDQALSGIPHAVMRGVLVGNSLQDRDSLVYRRLLDQERLQPSLQRRVLLDVLAILGYGRGPDHLQLSPGQCGLEHVGGVDPTFGGPGAH